MKSTRGHGATPTAPIEYPPGAARFQQPELREIPLTCTHTFPTYEGPGRNSAAPKPGDRIWCVRCDGPSMVPAGRNHHKPRDSHMPPLLAKIAAASREEGWSVQAVQQGAGKPVRGWMWSYHGIRLQINRKTTPTREWWTETLNSLKEIGAPIDAR